MIVEIACNAEITGRFVAGMEPVYDKVTSTWKTNYKTRIENFRVKLIVPRGTDAIEKVDITEHLGLREYSKLYEAYMCAVLP